MRIPNVVKLGAVLVLAACGSSPQTRFYTLAAVPGHAAQTGNVVPFCLTQFTIPETLDRLSLVRRTDKNRLDVDDVEQWGAPLDSMARTVLAQDLGARLPAGSLMAADAGQGGDADVLIVRALDFMPQPDGTTKLDADWDLLSPEAAQRIMQRHVHIVVPGGSNGGAAQADAMSRALARLADEIAAGLPAPDRNVP